MSRIAEIVRFTLRPGQEPAQFDAAAAATGALLAARPGFLGRHLSQGPDGRWTDHVLWADMAAARQAAHEVMADPVAAPFLEAIDGASIEMRHEEVHWQMP